VPYWFRIVKERPAFYLIISTFPVFQVLAGTDWMAMQKLPMIRTARDTAEAVKCGCTEASSMQLERKIQYWKCVCVVKCISRGEPWSCQADSPDLAVCRSTCFLPHFGLLWLYLREGFQCHPQMFWKHTSTVRNLRVWGQGSMGASGLVHASHYIMSVGASMWVEMKEWMKE
jgi:hypothetical protein